MIYPYISFLNNHFSNIFAIFAFNETSKIVKQDHAQETTQGNPHRLRRLPATRLPSGREVSAPDRLPAAHRTTGNRITAAEPHPLYPDGACPYFRDSAPVTYARGFTGMQSRMFPAQYQQFMSILMSHFGRNPYFERRRGEFPLSPKEQRIVLNALRRVGVTEELRFDHYEESVNWYD